MKKVAFDVSGTLMGPEENKVLKLFYWFKSQGCEMFIWSSELSYTYEAQKMHHLEAKCLSKFTKADAKKNALDPMDICVDDDKLQKLFLASNKAILVEEIPEDPALFEANFGKLLEKH